jgi:peptidoglycan/xylan/chitin deacetylase (PgdA/CDA1 family)
MNISRKIIAVPLATFALMNSSMSASAIQAAQASPDCLLVKCVALTYGGGPNLYTNGLLDLLSSRNVKATFYINGSSQDMPSVVRREAAEGHQIGNGTWDHPDLTTLDAQQVNEEVVRLEKVHAKLVGGTWPDKTLRPPYGEVNTNVLKIAKTLGYPVITWSVDSIDYSYPNDLLKEEALIKQGLAANPTSPIIRMNDSLEPTVKQLTPWLIEYLHSNNYKMVTIDQMFAHTPLVPGTLYAHGPGRP